MSEHLSQSLCPRRKSAAESIASAIYRTPALPPPEELKLLQVWEKLLDFFDNEAQRAQKLGGAEFGSSSSPALSNYSASPGHSPRRHKSTESSLRLREAERPGSHESSICSSGSPGLSAGKDTEASSVTSLFSSSARSNQRKERLQNISSLRDSYWTMLKDDHPDEVVNRFLAQQKWDVDMAFERILASIRWRMTSGVLNIIRSGEQGAFDTLQQSKNPRERKAADGFVRLLREGASYSRGTDRSGRPVVLIRSSRISVTAHPMESVEKFILWNTETLRLVMSPAVENTILIYDMTGAGMANVDPAGSKFMTEIFPRYYPGAIAVVIIHRAPKLFEGVWPIVKRMMSPEAVKRIHFTRTVTDLERWIHRSQIPFWMGGDDPWKFQYPEPRPNESKHFKNDAAVEKLTRERQTTAANFEKTTRELLRATQNGDADISEIKERREGHVRRSREIFWMLDPMQRARSFYDRWGMIDFRRNSALQIDPASEGANERLAQLYADVGIDVDVDLA